MADVRPRNVALRRYLRRRGPDRILYDHQNPLERYPPSQFRDRYRFWPDTVVYFCHILAPRLERPTERSNALPVILQVCTTLRFLACGSFLLTTGDCDGMSKSSVSRVLNAALPLICGLLPIHVKFPSSREEVESTKREFFEIAGKSSPTVFCFVFKKKRALHQVPRKSNESEIIGSRIMTS